MTGLTAKRTCWLSARPGGKSWIACALGHKACRDNRLVAYHRVPRLLEALALARGEGARSSVPADPGRLGIGTAYQRATARSAEDRGRSPRPRLDDVTSQVPVDHWYEVIGGSTIADAMLDRLVHNADRLVLSKSHCIDGLPRRSCLTPKRSPDPITTLTTTLNGIIGIPVRLQLELLFGINRNRCPRSSECPQ